MEDMDRISALPDEVIHIILSFLKVEEAAPTMILSKRWSYLWTFNPNLHFGGEYYGACNIAAIDGCVKKYQADQLQTFCIESMLWNVEVAHIQQWLDFAIEKKVNHLTFRGNWFTVPDSLFSSRWLQSLTLSNCHLHRPSDIKCFDSLKHLDLYNITDPDGAVQSLLSKCQRLQSLFLNTDPCPDPINASISLPDLRELNVSFKCSTLTICAPSLQSLEVHGDISGKLVVQSAPCVKRARFGFRDDFKSPLDVDSWGFIIQSIANVETLLLSDQVLQLHTLYCSKGKRLTFKNLKVLHVHYLWSFPSLYPRLFSLFQDCPWLEEIHFDLMVTYGSRVDWEEMGLEGPPDYEDVDVDVSSDIHNHGFDHLKLVKMVHFSGCPKQMGVINFLLEKATVLESVHIVFNREVKDKEEQLQYMSQLPTISPSVTIKRIEQEVSL